MDHLGVYLSIVLIPGDMGDEPLQVADKIGWIVRQKECEPIALRDVLA